jgi:hypothetical protein
MAAVETTVPKTATNRDRGDRADEFQSTLELPPAKTPFNLSQQKQDKKQGNHPYG